MHGQCEKCECTSPSATTAAVELSALAGLAPANLVVQSISPIICDAIERSRNCERYKSQLEAAIQCSVPAASTSSLPGDLYHENVPCIIPRSKH